MKKIYHSKVKEEVRKKMQLMKDSHPEQVELLSKFRHEVGLGIDWDAEIEESVNGRKKQRFFLNTKILYI